MKKRKALVLLLCLFCLTGCTKMLKNEDNQVVKNEKTGQTITENIICKPTDESTLKIYEEYEVNIEKLDNLTVDIVDEYLNLYGTCSLPSDDEYTTRKDSAQIITKAIIIFVLIAFLTILLSKTACPEFFFMKVASF